jgi:hypothetical protein
MIYIYNDIYIYIHIYIYIYIYIYMYIYMYPLPKMLYHPIFSWPSSGGCGSVSPKRELLGHFLDVKGRGTVQVFNFPYSNFMVAK